MAFNPMQFMKLKERLDIFKSQHPRVAPFLSDVSANGIRVGSVIEMKVTTPEGKEYITNIRVTEEDLETVGMIRDMTSSGT